MAKKINIVRNSGTLDISYSWRTASSWFILLWAIFWNSFVVFFLLVEAGWFISVHLIVGVVVGYFAATRFVNKSTITVSTTALKIAHGPMPWPFTTEHDIPARSLVQLYVGKSNVRINKQPTYNLKAKLDTGAELTLFNAEPDRELLLELERTIEAYLHISNDETFDLSSGGHTALDLDEMKEQLEMLQPIKKWLPNALLVKMEEAEAKIHQQAAEKTLASPTPGAPPRGREDWEVGLHPGTVRPRVLPASSHDFNFALYSAPTGEVFHWNHQPFRVGRSAQIDWDNGHQSSARQFEITGVNKPDTHYFYTENERGRWSYYEERRLDDDEVSKLGFSASQHPLRFDNGPERYYPRDEQRGQRFVAAAAQAVQQYIYFTTSSVTQFRALRPTGGAWEVYVMEPVDAGGFDPVPNK